MMNWLDIKNNYPKSYEHFVSGMFPNVGIPSVSSLNFFDNKKLYKFFDDNGIYLNIEMYNPRQWVFTVSLKNGIVIGNGLNSRETREEVEIDGFNECFKMLEKRLKAIYE